MFKRVVIMTLTAVVLAYALWHIGVPPEWQRLYTKALLSGDISVKSASYLLLADIDYDSTPELIVKYMGYGGDVYSINDSKVENYGYIGFNELGQYKSKHIGENLWISMYRIDYKYGYTDYVDEIHCEVNKVINSNIFIYNEDVRGEEMVYWEYKGKLVNKEEYAMLYSKYWEQMEIANKPVPLLHLDNLNEAMISEWMDSWRTVDSFQHD